MTLCALYRLDPPISQQNYISLLNNSLEWVPNYMSDNFDMYLKPIQDVNHN